MKAAFKRLRENYILLWLFIGLGLISFTAGVKTAQQMDLAGVAKLEAFVKQHALAAAND